MGKYNLDKLWRLWQCEQITPEMAIGHLLQNLLELKATIHTLQQTVSKLQVEVRQSRIDAGQLPQPASRKNRKGQV